MCMDLRRFRALVRAMRTEGVAKYSETSEGAVTIELAPQVRAAQPAAAETRRKLDPRETKSIDEFLRAHLTGEVS